MTQKKADSDPWLTDMVSRDKEIAKSVVYGMRTIISLLRGIRDEMAEENRALRTDLREVRQEVRDLWEHSARMNNTSPSALELRESRGFPNCESASCSLPQGHQGNHRGSLRSA